MTFSRGPNSAFGLLTDEAMSQIDAICERFEADWKAGASPSAESWVENSGVAATDALLYELLGIESYYRRHDADFCEAACARRFPAHAGAIRNWFAAGDLRPGRHSASLPAAATDAVAGDLSTLSYCNSERAVRTDVCFSPAVEGRFRVLRPYASGGLGQIWLAHDEELGRDVALKQIKSRNADDPHCQARFFREAQTTGRLEHPGIVPVYALGRDRQGRPFYAMRLVSGETLAAAIDRWHQAGARPGVEFRKLLTHFLAVCNVVDFAHSRGVIHRDLKPLNIMLGEFGETVVLDWGLARQIGESAATRPADQAQANGDGNERTEDGTVLGTRGYMSPEQAAGNLREVDTASDLYSLGAILYRILAGRSPEPIDIRPASNDGAHRPPAPRAKNPRAPAALEAICLKAMSFDKHQRYASMRLLAEDVERWLADEPVAVHRESWLASLARWSRRHKPLVAAGIVGGLVLLASLAIIVVLQQRSQQRIAERNRVIERQRDESYTQIEREQISKAARVIEQADEVREALRAVPEPRRGWECQRLWFELDLRPHPLSSWPSHDWGVLDLLWHEPTQTLVSTGHDGRMLLRTGTDSEPLELVGSSWSPQRLAWRHALFGFPDDPPDWKADDCFLRLAWLEPGKAFAAVSLGGKLAQWHLTDGGGVPAYRERARHDRPLFSIAAQKDAIACGDDQGAVLLVSLAGDDLQIRKPLRTTAPVLDLAALPDGRWAAAQADGTITLLDRSATKAAAVTSVDGPAWDLDVSPDGSLLAVGCGRGQVDCYRIDTSSEAFVRHESYLAPTNVDDRPTALSVVRFSPDGQWLAAGDERGRLLVWDRTAAKLGILAPTHRVISEDRVDTLPWPFRRRLAAIAFSRSGDECFIAGHDPVLRRWQVRGRKGITEFAVGVAPRVRFDPVQTPLLWAGTADGMLSVWDSRSGRRIAQTRAHAAPVAALDVVATQKTEHRDDSGGPPGESLAATCDAAGVVRLWRLRGDELAAEDTAIKHNQPLDHVAVSPDGRRIAAYDRQHLVLLWERATGRLLASRDLSKSGGSLPKARLAFNCDGTRLAAFGPGTVLWLLGGSDLAVLERPDVIAGQGGTALAWHPLDPGTLFAGDMLGRVLAHPRRAWRSPRVEPRRAEVAGIGWSPAGDGGRAAVGWRNGEICIVDIKWAGELLRLRSPHAAGETALTNLLFDAQGERLAAVFDDGALEIWETRAATREPSAASVRHWRRSELAAGQEFTGLELRRQAVVLDEHDRLAMFATTFDRDQAAASPEAEGRRWLFLREGDRAVQTEVMPYRAVSRCLTLTRNGEDWLATVRRPLPEEGGVSGAFLLMRGRQRPGADRIQWSEEDLTPRPNNEGFDAELLPAAGQLPTVVHFTHSGWYLLATWHDGRQWKTVRLGRQGDGYRHLTAATPDGKTLYSVFSPGGLNGELWNIACQTTDWQPPTGDSDGASLPGSREICETAFRARPCSLAIDALGAPLLLYTRSSETAPPGLVLARRAAHGWQKSTVFEFVPRVVSNMTIDANGNMTFSYLSSDERAVYLAIGQGERWAKEMIAEVPERESDGGAGAEISELILLRDGRGRPIIIVAARGRETGAIQCFRPLE